MFALSPQVKGDRVRVGFHKNGFCLSGAEIFINQHSYSGINTTSWKLPCLACLPVFLGEFSQQMIWNALKKRCQLKQRIHGYIYGIDLCMKICNSTLWVTFVWRGLEKLFRKIKKVELKGFPESEKCFWKCFFCGASFWQAGFHWCLSLIACQCR